MKAWAYALSRLRSRVDSRIVSDTWFSRVSSEVDIEVVIAPPLNATQTRVFEEAEQVFHQLDAVVRTLEEVDAVGIRAVELLREHVG